ncbi:MAG TPA: insulinase family protein [Blastocatellia bacterium]|nr:insulinase family protein [Blastocatellia bacterium]
MPRNKPTAISLFILIVLVFSPLSAVSSQSGRSRPRVPTRIPEAPPEPVKVPEAAGVVRQEQIRNVSRFVLRNGITVIISEQHATPLAAAVAYFKAGRMDETELTLGAAELLARASAAAKARDLAALGASGGAYAAADHSAFYLTVAPERLKDALSVQAQMIRSLPLSSDDSQGGSSFDETTDREGQAGKHLEMLKSVAFTRRGTGKLQNTDTPSVPREHLLEFSRMHYRPEKLILSVCGAVSTFHALVEIQRLYAGFAPPAAEPQPPKDQTANRATPAKSPASGDAGPAQQTRPAAAQKPPLVEPAATTRLPEPEQTKLRYAADRGDIEQSVVTVGFRVPGLNSKSWPAIEVLSALAGRGRASRLARALLDEQAVVSAVQSDYVALADAGLLTIQMKPAFDPSAGTLMDKAESALFREIDRLRRVVPSEAELARAKSVLEGRFIDRVESYCDRALLLAHAEAMPSGLRAALDYRRLIREVRAEDVQRAASAYLTLAGASVHEFEPVSAPPRTFDSERFAATVLAWAPGFAEAVSPKEVISPDPRNAPPVIAQGVERPADELAALESIEPLPIRDFSTLNGPRAFVREDHSEPKVTIALLFPGGRIAEDETRSGITEFMLRAMLRGTPRRPSNEVSFELEQLGADVEIIAEPDFFGLVAEVLSRNADRALKIMRDLIEDPAFRDSDLARARAEQTAVIRESLGSGAARSRELLFQALFAGHPYSLPPHGRQEVVSKLTGDQVREWHEGAIKRRVPVAIIVGDTEGSALVSGTVADGFKRRETDPPARYPAAAATKPTDRAEQYKRPQSVLSIGFPGPRGGSDEALALGLIESAMNVLLGELGSKQGSFYVARSSSESFLAGGAFRVDIVTSPENEQRVRTAVVAEIERLAKNGLSVDQVTAARAQTITARLGRLQHRRERALEYARTILYEHRPAEADSLADRLGRITPDEIKRVAGIYLKPSTASLGIVRGER